MKYLFSKNIYVCPIWIFIFDTDQAQINSVYQHKLSNFLFRISMIHFCVMAGPFLSMSERRHSEVARLYEADLHIEEE